MTQLLDRPRIGTYARPALEPLGSLRALTKGAGPGGEPIVMATGDIQRGELPTEAPSAPVVVV
jgi:hypothetical protein